MNIKLIVGLGNPGSTYANNRHNIGYKVLDHLENKWGVWPHIKYFDDLFEGILRITYKELVILIKPTTFMNSSGLCVAKVVKELNIKPNNILVVYDDISLPLGTIRLREKGSAGGHNGVKSIIQELGTEEFNRLRIGIGKPIDDTSILDYVLGDFTEFENVEETTKCAESIISSILNGVITKGDTFIYKVQ